jgi:hypothetical protein
MSITVYWAPGYEISTVDWNMLYADPVSLFDKHLENKTNIEKWDSFFYCPAFKNLAKNTLEFKNPLNSKYTIDEHGNLSLEENSMFAKIIRPPSIQDRYLIEYGFLPIFFSDHDISVTMTSPWLESPGWTKDANIIPGRFNIGKWFRVANVEFMLSKGTRELSIKKDDPLVYFTFNTDEHIKFVRFKMDEELKRYSSSCASASSWEPWIPLAERYRRFKESRMRDLILKKIKENIV